MPLSWNEIRNRTLSFAKKWKDESSEDAEAKSFWDGFFDVFGITRRRVASFEEPVKKLGGAQGFIDLFWKGVMLVEHKSRGKNLDKAYSQALDYFAGIPERDLPKYVLVSDFARFRLYDLESGEQFEFPLQELHKNIKLFGFIAGYQTHKIRTEDPVNIKAAELMGRLHDQMQAVGYDGHPLEVYLVRLLFCVFAEDTGIFEKQQFHNYLENHTAEDGTDLGHHLSTLFHVLNTPHAKRLKNLHEDLADFQYINGSLFEEMLPPASFDRTMRQALLDCCGLDWSRISPAIFGSLFQSIMDKQARRNLGAHYTSEANILKLIGPLFLDELRAEFEKIRGNKRKLEDFHQRLGKLTFLDPACGCGNFLVITYRELRLLELEVLRELRADEIQGVFDISNIIWVDIGQFYGIEIEEFPARIAEVALWLIDHQMNLLVSEEYGEYFARIPLRKTQNIVHANALRLDWNEVIPAAKLNYILGNPPFLGKNFQSEDQKKDVAATFYDSKTAGSLDFVCAWYRKALDMMQNNSALEAAFVSTNSITQGEQACYLWGNLLGRGCKINFAHRTFAWTNEARGKAAVHCVIIGFAGFDRKQKWLYEYAELHGHPQKVNATQINGYLIDGTLAMPIPRKKPLCQVPEMINGSKPTDGGNLLLDQTEKDELIAKEPKAAKWIKPFSMGEEFINNIPRFCLWLMDCPPNELRSMPEVLKRVEAVRKMRTESTKKQTQDLANYPTVFGEIRQPKTSYLAIPRVSSENRTYIPIGYLPSEHIAGDKLQLIPKADLFIFGTFTSEMHMAWMKVVTGRLESRFQYSSLIVYNNFPWPTFDGMDNKTIAKHKSQIETFAQAVLDARAEFPNASLADLYDPLTMPPTLLKAHQNLDKAVDAAYGVKSFKSEAERVAFLFELYQKYTSFLPVEGKKKGRGK
jgi:hypothetical protein